MPRFKIGRASCREILQAPSLKHLSGTTHIGKYVINHSFILPGLIGVSTSCVVGYFIALAKHLV